MKKTNYAIIDIETGGFSKEKNAICEIAVIIIDDFHNELARYEAIIKPYRRVRSEELASYQFEAMQCHNITMEEIENGKDIETVIEELTSILEIYNATTFIGHNAKAFDFKWVSFLIEEYGSRPFDFLNCIDTLLLGRQKVYGLSSYSLSSLCSFYGIQNRQSHRAMGDVESTLELFVNLTKK